MSLHYVAPFLMTVVTMLVFAIAGFVVLGLAIRGPTKLRGPTDALVVFASSVPWRAHSRCTHAVKLFHAGMASEILVSGGARVLWGAASEAEWFRERLIRDGVPANQIVLETESESTLENVARTRPIIDARGYRSVALVSSEYLGFYVRYLVDHMWQGLDVRVYAAHAPSTGHWSPWTWWTSREGWRLTRESFERYRRAKKIIHAPRLTRVLI